MAVIPDLSDLRRRSQDNLIDFLRIEVELAETFSKVSKTTTDPEHRAKLEQDIRTVVETIRQFLDRITEPKIRRELSAQADRLEGFGLG